MKSDLSIGVLTVAFNEERLIGPCVWQFKGFKFTHVVLVSEKPWNGNWESDDTARRAINAGAYAKIGNWPGQAEQFNYGLETYFPGYDWVLIVDADEFYTKKDINILIKELSETDADAITAPNMEVFWRKPFYRVFPKQTDNPIIAVRPHVRFTNKRSAECSKSGSEATLYHMSYVRSDEEMLKKIDSFEHTNEFNKDYWYNNVWMKWRPDYLIHDLHPVVPSQFKTVGYSPAPQEIVDLLAEI